MQFSPVMPANSSTSGVSKFFARFEREQLASFIEIAIALIDEADSDENLEDDGEAEPDDPAEDDDPLEDGDDF
ncbi:MAG: hypothetical protein LC648_02480 [Novosphingobium sp.]|nr:hypothetical protein [Novosphingobium sp.]